MFKPNNEWSEWKTKKRWYPSIGQSEEETRIAYELQGIEFEIEQLESRKYDLEKKLDELRNEDDAKNPDIQVYLREVSDKVIVTTKR